MAGENINALKPGASLHLFKNETDKAIEQASRAIALNSRLARAWRIRALHLCPHGADPGQAAGISG
jgi:hypothetical protein